MVLRGSELRRFSRGRLAVLIAGVSALVFASGVLIIPWLESRGVSGASVLRQVYAPLCHQIPARSLTLGARPLAVCARCTGLYVGGVAGLLVAAALALGNGPRARPWWLFAAVAPSVLEFGLSWCGVGGLANIPRGLLALPAGAMAGLFLSIGIHDLFEWRKGAGRGEILASGSAREG